MSNQFPYEDIVNLPAHISQKYPQASLADRAARFSPFAAITGYEDMVTEVARTTDEKIQLDDNVLELLNNKLELINASIQDKPLVSIKYFVPDHKKNGGSYETIKGRVKRINSYFMQIELISGEQVPIADIVEIDLLLL